LTRKVFGGTDAIARELESGNGQFVPKDAELERSREDVEAEMRASLDTSRQDQLKINGEAML
jgi:hypothetical protein